MELNSSENNRAVYSTVENST